MVDVGYESMVPIGKGCFVSERLVIVNLLEVRIVVLEEAERGVEERKQQRISS
jgi:hypothetical protein